MKAPALVILLMVPLTVLLGQTKADSLRALIAETKIDTSKVIALRDLAKIVAAEDFDSATVIAHQGRQLAERIDWPRGRAESYYQLGRLSALQYLLDSAILYYQRSIVECDATGDRKRWADNHYYMGNAISNQDNYPGALENYRKALAVYEKLGTEMSIMRISINIAWVLSESGEYPEAVEFLYHAIRLAEKLDAPKSVFNAQHELGYVHLQMGNLDDALKVFTENEALAEELDEPYKRSIAYGDLGLYYGEIDDNEKALSYHLKDLEIQLETDNKLDLPLIYNNIGSCYLDMGQFENAISYFQQSLDVEMQHRNAYNNTLSILQMGQAYRGLGNISQAISYSERAVAEAKAMQNPQLLIDARLSLIESYKEAGDYRAALQVTDSLQVFQDSLFALEKNRQLSEIQTQYETEKKEKEILALEKTAAIDKGKRRQLLIGLIATILIGVLIIFLIWQKRRKDRRILTQQRELEVQKRKNIELENEKLNRELEFKKQELAAKVLQLCKKNEFLQNLEKQVTELSDSDDPNVRRSSQRITHTIQRDIAQEGEWDEFLQTFTEVHQSFIPNLQAEYENLTKNELRLACLLKMNLSSKEISSMLNVSSEGVKKARYRLRKKLKLTTEEDLEQHLIAI